MILRHCICIPTYNNPDSIKQVVEHCLQKTSYPILVIDDGSDLPVQALLPEDPRLTILRHEQNRGKGRSLQLAIEECARRGHTHMLTMDADGQHPVSEVEKLVKRSKESPWSLVVGARSWEGNGDVPAISRFGRSFSNFWMWYQTGYKVEDTQSGFRVYPIFPIQTWTFYTKRFDFELEVMVRLLWSGTQVESVPVEIFYPKASERVSHFHKFWDNARITVMNILIIILSLFRLHLTPAKAGLACLMGLITGYALTSFVAVFLVLAFLTFLTRVNGWVVLFSAITGHYLLRTHLDLGAFIGVCMGVCFLLGGVSYQWRRYLKRPKKTWSGTMRGGRFGNALIKAITSQLGLGAAYFCMFFVVPYFYFFAPKGKRASRQFMKILDPTAGFLKLRLMTLLHFWRFSTLLLDRLFQSIHADIQFETRSAGAENMRAVVKQQKGGMLIGAHFGALDIAARTMGKKGYTESMVRAEFFADQGLIPKKVFGQAKHSEKDLAVLSQQQQSLLSFRELILGGTSICLMGDRPMTNQYELVVFMGKLAAFDTTPFRVAALCEASVQYCYGVREGFKKYVFSSTIPKVLRYESGLAKEVQLLRWAQEYASHLESVVREHPYQWSNFYPFWSALPTSPTRDLSGKKRYSLLQDILRPVEQL